LAGDQQILHTMAKILVATCFVSCSFIVVAVVVAVAVAAVASQIFIYI